MTTKVVVYKSNKSLEVQLIENDKTLIGRKFAFSAKLKPADQTLKFGEEFAKLLNEKKINKISFCRGKNKYHGAIKNFADGLRKSGIIF